MATLGKTFTFDAAHRLQHHAGKCHNLHGHTYRVEVILNGFVMGQTGESNEGMLLDFDQLKKWWKHLEPGLDHNVILDEADPLVDALQAFNEAHPKLGVNLTMLDFAPTAENLSRWIFEDLTNWLIDNVGGQGVRVQSVRVYETPTSWAQT